MDKKRLNARMGIPSEHLRMFLWTGVLYLFFTCAMEAQQLESIGQRDPLKITGGLNLNNIFYGAQGIDSRRDPYSYYLTGNLNVDLYGWVVPVSFSYSNQNFSYQQPFNQYSIHPTYKWATAHIGYASMTFSPYTLNGHIFKGAGVELTPPGRFKFSAMYGRLQKAVEPDTVNGNSETAAFQRMGWGVKAGYAHKGTSLDVIVFRAKDQLSSINHQWAPEDVRPQENLVLSLAGGQTFFKKLLVQVEYASSALTRDTRASELRPETNQVFSYTGPLFKTRSSSAYYNAFKTGMTYQGKTYTLGIAYEWIDPEYRTLGAYYFNNDLENITANATKTLFKGKLNLAANGGVQRDNLDDSKVSTMKRLVGSLNVGYTPTDRLNLSASYSSFTTFTNIRSKFVAINQATPYDNLDTLNYSQVSQSAGANINYLLKGKESYRQSINLNLTAQEAIDRQGGEKQPSGSLFYNLNSSYTIDVVPASLGFSLALNYSQNKMQAMNTSTWGPTLGIRKAMFDKKLRMMVSTSMNSSYNNTELIGEVWSYRLGINFSVRKSHSFSLSAQVLNRKNKRAMTTERYTEFTGIVGYSYAF